MNDQKFDCQARIQAQPNHGLITDCNSEFATRSSRLFGPHNQPHNMGLYVQQQHQHNHQQQVSMDHSQASLSQLQSLAKHSPSSTIMSRFDSPTSAFYATERCMGFPQYESQVGNYNQFSSGESYSFEASDQTEPGFEFRSSLQTVVKPNNNIPLMFGNDHNKIIHDLDSTNTNINTSTSATSPSIRRQFSINLKENQDIGVCSFISFFLVNLGVVIFFLVWVFVFWFIRVIVARLVRRFRSWVLLLIIKISNLQDSRLEIVLLLALLPTTLLQMEPQSLTKCA